jgi:hypothetical protein
MSAALVGYALWVPDIVKPSTAKSKNAMLCGFFAMDGLCALCGKKADPSGTAD